MNKLSEKFLEEKKQKYFLFFLLFLLFCSVFILNKLFPLFGEDWDYCFFWTMDGLNPNRLENVADIFISQYNHYLIWGGRSVVHTIDQFLILIGSPWNDFINSLAYVSLVFLVYKMINYRNKTSIRIFLLVSFSLWFLLPDMPSLILWLTYSSVYMWGTLITIVFMYVYYKYYRMPKAYNDKVMSPIMLISGVIAGWTYENLSLALVCFLVLLFFAMRYTKMKIPKWMIFGFVGAVVGCALLILAPGNYLRASGTLLSDVNVVYMVLYRVWDLLRVYVYHILFLLILYSFVFCFFVKKSDVEDKLKVKLVSIILVISAHFGLVVMLASPIFPARTLFGLVIFMIMGVGVLFANIPMNSLVSRSLNWLVIGVIFVFYCLNYNYRYTYVSYFHDFWKQREIFVEEQKEQGVEDVVFKDNLMLNMDFIESTCELKPDANGWPNFSYAKYHNLRSVRKK